MLLRLAFVLLVLGSVQRALVLLGLGDAAVVRLKRCAKEVLSAVYRIYALGEVLCVCVACFAHTDAGDGICCATLPADVISNLVLAQTLAALIACERNHASCYLGMSGGPRWRSWRTC